MEKNQIGAPSSNHSSAKELDYSRPGLLEIWRECLTMGQADDPHDTVVAELAEYFKMDPQEVRQRCINWEDDSLKEWEAKDRSTPEGLLDFYRTQVSWIFDTVWYHADQYYEIRSAESVDIIYGLTKDHGVKPGNHLDFGAGPGSSSLFSHKLGWQVALADISTTMQDFAKWRLAKHGVVDATYYDNSQEKLPTQAFDLITAFDVMVHIPDIQATLEDLHRALKPGGYLVFNIDNLPLTAKTQWHLYDEQYPILGKVRAIGFQRHPKISYFHIYQKIERSPTNTQLIRFFDKLRYNRAVTKLVGNPARRLLRVLKNQVKV